MSEEIMTVQPDAAVEVVDIQFRPGQKVYYFDPAGMKLTAGDHVIMDTARGPEFGICTGGNHRIAQKDVVLPLRPVLRKANEWDERTVAENRETEKKAHDFCMKKITELENEQLAEALTEATLARDLPGMADVDSSLLLFCEEIKKNFTPYPVRQRGNANYRSGTLTAYIGKARNGQYVDSVELMEALNALSTSKMTKFLKTRKGEILRVETSAPISMQVGDKYAVQPAKITLPWVEVGSAKGASIILTENETLTMTN